MIDFDDAGDFGFAGALIGGVGGAILLILALVFFLAAAGNEADCKKKSCPGGQTPRLMDHDCLCAERAK